MRRISFETSLELRQRISATANMAKASNDDDDDGRDLKRNERQKPKRNYINIMSSMTVLLVACSLVQAESASNPLLLAPDFHLTQDERMQCDIVQDETENDTEEVDPNYVSMEAQASEFRLPAELMEEGEVMPFVWKSDGKQADEYARLIGLPFELTNEIYNFTVQSGLLDVFRNVLYNINGSQKSGMHSQILQGLNTKGQWAVTSPGELSNWKDSNLHWIDAIDEEAYEETLQVLKRGGFDTVLQAIGNEFNCEGLMIAGVGFIAVSHSNGADRHADDPGVQDRFFDMLFPLVLPENDVSQLFIGDDEDANREAPYNYTIDEAVLISGDTDHRTGECDYRESKEMRVAVSIYIADLNDEIAKVISMDDTALFPLPDNIEWLMAQKGRLWGKGRSLKHDPGRKPYTPKDLNETWCSEQAKAGKCNSNGWEVRPECPKSCGIFIDDERYYSEVIVNTAQE